MMPYGRVVRVMNTVPEKGWLWKTHKKGGASIKNVLKEKNFRPKKSLGQNFMEDDDVLRAIVERAGLSEESMVIEVGPGTGAMTRYIMDQGAWMTVIEKDDRLYEELVQQFGSGEDEEHKIRIVHGDVMRQNLDGIVQELKQRRFGACADAKKQRIAHNEDNMLPKVMANLPYNLTKDFLVRYLPQGDSLSSLLLMIQHEVAVRLVQNSPGSADWRSMNVIVEYYCEPEYLFRVDRFKYTPVPKVDGAVVDFVLKPAHARAEVPSEQLFLSIVKRAFLQRRKMLTNALQPLLSGTEIAGCLEKVGLPMDARAQNLSTENFVALSWAIHEALFGGALD